MKMLLTNKRYFSVLFFFILILDIAVKLNLEAIPYRLITKPLVVLSLLFFFLKNNKSHLKSNFVIIALISFLIGDIFLIFYENITLYILGLILFVVGKLFYASKFSNQRDFNMLGLIPFFALCFAYMVFIMLLVMNNLGAFFFPTLLYLFACLIVILFAYLRKGEVNNKSFIIVLIGVTVAILCDSITVIQSFYYEEFPFHEILIMFLYGLSQYLIIIGLLEENKQKDNVTIL